MGQGGFTTQKQRIAMMYIGKPGSCFDHNQFSHTKNAQRYFGMNVFKSYGCFDPDLRKVGAEEMSLCFQLISVFQAFGTDFIENWR